MHSPITASIIAQMAVSDRGGTTRRRNPGKRTRRTRTVKRSQID